MGEFLDCLPDNERKIANILQELITDSIPNVQEKLPYNVPISQNITEFTLSGQFWGLRGRLLSMECSWGFVMIIYCKTLATTRKKALAKTYAFRSVPGIDEPLIHSFLYALAIKETLQ